MTVFQPIATLGFTVTTIDDCPDIVFLKQNLQYNKLSLF